MFLNNCFTRFLSVAILASELASFSLASVIENLDKRAGTKVQAAYFTNWYVCVVITVFFNSCSCLAYLKGYLWRQLS